MYKNQQETMPNMRGKGVMSKKIENNLVHPFTKGLV